MSQLTEENKTRLEGVLRRFIRDYLPQTNDGKVSFVKADGTRADVDAEVIVKNMAGAAETKREPVRLANGGVREILTLDELIAQGKKAPISSFLLQEGILSGLNAFNGGAAFDAKAFNDNMVAAITAYAQEEQATVTPEPETMVSETTGLEGAELVGAALRRAFRGIQEPDGTVIDRSSGEVLHVSENTQVAIADRLMTLYSEGSDTVQPAHALGGSIDAFLNQDAIKRVLSHYGDGNVAFEDNVRRAVQALEDERRVYKGWLGYDPESLDPDERRDRVYASDMNMFQPAEGSIGDRLGSYFSKEDRQTLANLFEDSELTGKQIDRIVEVVRGLDARGLTYSLSASNTTNNKVLTLNIREEVGGLVSNIGKMTVYDEKRPGRIGQLRTNQGTYAHRLRQLDNADGSDLEAVKRYLMHDFVTPAMMLDVVDLRLGRYDFGTDDKNHRFDIKRARDVADRQNRTRREADKFSFKSANGASFRSLSFNGHDVYETEDGALMGTTLRFDTNPNAWRSSTFKSDVEAETFIRDAIRFARDDWNNKLRTADAMKIAETTVNLSQVLRDDAFLSTDDAIAVRQDLKELEREFVDGFPVNKSRAKALLSDLRTYYRNLDENGRFDMRDNEGNPLAFESQFFSHNQPSAERFAEFLASDPEDITAETLRAFIIDEEIGDYDKGFNPAMVVRDYVSADHPNLTDAMTAALKVVNYPIDELRLSSMSQAFMVERMTSYDDNRSYSLADIQALDSGRAIVGEDGQLIRFDGPDGAEALEEAKRNGYKPRVAFGANVLLNEDGSIKGFEDDFDALYAMAQNPETAYVSNRQRAMLTAVETLENAGVKDIDIRIDDKGVIYYEGLQNVAPKKDAATGELIPYSNAEVISGEIGQVFDEDENGMVHTQFVGRDNYGFVPTTELYFTMGDKDPSELIHERVNGDDAGALERLRANDFGMKLDSVVRQAVMQQMVTPTVNTGSKDNPEYRRVETFGGCKLNRLYRKSAGQRFAEDYVEDSEKRIGNTQARVVIMTERMRCKFRNEYDEKASMRGAIDYEKHNYAVRPTFDALDKTGGRNIRESHAFYRGIFDMTATGLAKQAGMVRYMTIGSKVDPETGRLVKSEVSEKTALTALPEMAYLDYCDPARANMSIGQYLKAHDIDLNARVATMNFNGFGFDDGVIISKQWAEKMSHPSLDGNGRRAVVAGDKVMGLVDGNKGIAPVIIDPEWTEEEARERDLLREWQFFSDNPKVDVIMPVYSTNSRNNPGGHLLNMRGVHGDKEPDDLIIRHDDGSTEVLKNRLGWGAVMLTEQQVDKKSVIYDAAMVNNGRSRSVSGQLTWQLENMGLSKTIAEMFEDNTHSWINFREYAIAMGLDMDADGNILLEYEPQQGETKQVFTTDGSLSKEAFVDGLARSGGFIDLPFKLKQPFVEQAALNYETFLTKRMRDGEINNEALDALHELQMSEGFAETNQIYVVHPSLRREREVDAEDGVTIQHDFTEAYIKLYDASQSYSAIVSESAAMQKELEDFANSGSRYSAIAQFALDNKDLYSYVPAGASVPTLNQMSSFSDFVNLALEQGRDVDVLIATGIVDYNKSGRLTLGNRRTNKHIAAFDGTLLEGIGLMTGFNQRMREWAQSDLLLEQIQSDSQHVYNSMLAEINERAFQGPGFNGKHSVVRDKLLQTKRGQSATLTAKADPRLDLDQVMISAKAAAVLGVETDGYVLALRDPAWHTGNIRAMRVIVSDDPNYQGFAMNPAMDKCFDGDFDGDGFGFFGGFSPDVVEELKAKASVQAQLLDRSQLTDAYDENGEPIVDSEGNPVRNQRPLFINDGLELKTAEAMNPELVTMRRKAQYLANAGRGDEAVKLLSEYTRQAFLGDYAIGSASIDYTSEAHILKSAAEMVNDGAKGKPASLAGIAMWGGLDVTIHGVDDGKGGTMDLVLSPDALRNPNGAKLDVKGDPIKGTDCPVGYFVSDGSSKRLVGQLPGGLTPDDAHVSKAYAADAFAFACDKIKEAGRGSDFMPWTVERHMEEVEMPNGEKVMKHMSHATSVERNESERANATKADFTGDPGAMLQKAFNAVRGLDNEAANAACEAFYYVIQTNLQIKHDAAMAARLVGLYTPGGELYELMDGRDINDGNHGKDPVTLDQFVNRSIEIYSSLGFDKLDPQVFETFGQALCEEDEQGRQVYKGFRKGLEDANLLCNLAYTGGGLDRLFRASCEGESMFETDNPVLNSLVPQAILDKTMPIAPTSDLDQEARAEKRMTLDQAWATSKEFINELDEEHNWRNDRAKTDAEILAEGKALFGEEAENVSVDAETPASETSKDETKEVTAAEEALMLQNAAELMRDADIQDMIEAAGVDIDATGMTHEGQDAVLVASLAIGTPAKESLKAHHIATMNDLSLYHKDELLEMENIGPKTLDNLSEALAKHDLTFQADKSEAKALRRSIEAQREQAYQSKAKTQEKTKEKSPELSV